MSLFSSVSSSVASTGALVYPWQKIRQKVGKMVITPKLGWKRKTSGRKVDKFQKIPLSPRPCWQIGLTTSRICVYYLSSAATCWKNENPNIKIRFALNSVDKLDTILSYMDCYMIFLQSQDSIILDTCRKRLSAPYWRIDLLNILSILTDLAFFMCLNLWNSWAVFFPFLLLFFFLFLTRHEDMPDVLESRNCTYNATEHKA